MYINLYRQKRLADQRMQEALRVAKQDSLIRDQLKEARNVDRKFPVGIVMLPWMIIKFPFQLGLQFLKRKWA